MKIRSNFEFKQQMSAEHIQIQLDLYEIYQFPNVDFFVVVFAVDFVVFNWSFLVLVVVVEVVCSSVVVNSSVSDPS